MCQLQYCHWVNPSAQPYWKCGTATGISCSCLMNTVPFFLVLCALVCVRVVVYMPLFNELFVCWLNSWACLSLLLSVLPLGHLPFSCLFSWLLLRTRDKAHWCLSAPWQITEADRYKDSGRQLQYTGGQRRTWDAWADHSTDPAWMPSGFFVLLLLSQLLFKERCEKMWEVSVSFFELGDSNEIVKWDTFFFDL